MIGFYASLQKHDVFYANKHVCLRETWHFQPQNTVLPPKPHDSFSRNVPLSSPKYKHGFPRRTTFLPDVGHLLPKIGSFSHKIPLLYPKSHAFSHKRPLLSTEYLLSPPHGQIHPPQVPHFPQQNTTFLLGVRYFHPKIPRFSPRENFFSHLIPLPGPEGSI